MDITQNDLDFPENIFDDLGNDEIENIYNFDEYNNLDIDINLLIELINEPIYEDIINVICEITEEVPLRKKPRLHFHYQVIEN